ncbi:hypothetical protein GCM10009776_01610 [Microbacterium deminutum]|uniref:Uncharacterized protein n=1 Tax=Microbacterium deminutum TaxID=344164 RepID=A0ABN2Q6F3_9MICO
MTWTALWVWLKGMGTSDLRELRGMDGGMPDTSPSYERKSCENILTQEEFRFTARGS